MGNSSEQEVVLSIIHKGQLSQINFYKNQFGHICHCYWGKGSICSSSHIHVNVRSYLHHQTLCILNIIHVAAGKIQAHWLIYSQYEKSIGLDHIENRPHVDFVALLVPIPRMLYSHCRLGNHWEWLILCPAYNSHHRHSVLNMCRHHLQPIIIKTRYLMIM